MKYQYKRERSGFWVNIFENEDDSYSISTNKKYVELINYFFPMLESYSPTKWKDSDNFRYMSNLWLPDGCFDQNYINKFMEWCDAAIHNVLWLELNKNICEFFCSELDYCIASDFNIIYGDGRTEMGEAEYQLKYNSDNISKNEQKKYADYIMNKMLDNCKYIPISNLQDWYISPMPATESGKMKIAWSMAEAIARNLMISFVDATLRCEKPQMKQLSVENKILIWDNIYRNNKVIIDRNVQNKNIIVIDDLYQSGATIWQYAKFLKENGASSVFGLVCVKSLKDSDNK